jgi:hypothetical protein
LEENNMNEHEFYKALITALGQPVTGLNESDVRPAIVAGVVALAAASGGQAATQAASTATDVDGLLVDFNALLTKLKAAGLMAS